MKIFFKNVIAQIKHNWQLMILNGFIVYVMLIGANFVFWRGLPLLQNITESIATESAFIFKAISVVVPLALVTVWYSLFGFLILASIFVLVDASFGNSKNLFASFKSACKLSNVKYFGLKVVLPILGLGVILSLASQLIGNFNSWYEIVMGLYVAIPLYTTVVVLASRFIIAMYTDSNISVGINNLPSFKQIQNIGIWVLPLVTVCLFVVIKFLGLPLASEILVLAVFWVVAIASNQAIVMKINDLKMEVM